MANLKRSTASSWSSPDTHRPPSVISVDSLDDSYGLPSPSERNVVVKVRTRSGIRRFTMKAVSSTVWYIILLLSQTPKGPRRLFEKVRLCFDNKKVTY